MARYKICITLKIGCFIFLHGTYGQPMHISKTSTAATGNAISLFSLEGMEDGKINKGSGITVAKDSLHYFSLITRPKEKSITVKTSPGLWDSLKTTIHQKDFDKVQSD